jgi:hypothetical protein
MIKFLTSYFSGKSKNILLLLCFFGFMNKGFTQIVYTDISPDIATTMSSTQSTANNIYSVDFNGDGAGEYNFRWDDWGTEWFMHMTRIGLTNQMILKGAATNPFGGRFLQPLALNDVIDSSKNWGYSFPEPFIGESSMDANFLGLGDKYIGTKFTIAGNTYYGWVLVNFSLVNNARVLTIKSYAYNSTPNQAILAGQTTSLATQDLVKEKNSGIYPNPVKNIIHLKNNNKDQFSMLIFNNLGQVVLKNESIENDQINASDLEQGNYILELKNKNTYEINRIKFIKK